MTIETRNYLRKLDKMVGNLSAYLTAAAEYSDRVEHYDKATAKRYEDRVRNVPGELYEIVMWAEEHMPPSANANGQTG